LNCIGVIIVSVLASNTFGREFEHPAELRQRLINQWLLLLLLARIIKGKDGDILEYVPSILIFLVKLKC